MEAATLHCQSCGAAVGEHDLRCPYCHSQLATLACPKCLGMVPVDATHCPRCGAEIRRHEEAATDLACPGCKARLVHTSVSEAHLDQCHACGGVWVAQAEFEKMAADREERGEVLGALPGEAPKEAVHLEEVHYRPCPACGKLMNRSNYARTSGVVLDVCKDHGLWFDRDKLKRVLAFIEGGGLEKNRERDLEETRRQAVSCHGPEAWVEPPFPGEAGRGLLDRLLRGWF